MRLNQWARRLPWSVLILANLLLALGWVGIARCEDLTGGGPYLRLQIVWSTLALVAMLVVTLPSYRVLCRFSYGIFALALALLVLVYLFPVNGARRGSAWGPWDCSRRSSPRLPTSWPWPGT